MRSDEDAAAAAGDLEDGEIPADEVQPLQPTHDVVRVLDDRLVDELHIQSPHPLPCLVVTRFGVRIILGYMIHHRRWLERATQ